MGGSKRICCSLVSVGSSIEWSSGGGSDWPTTSGKSGDRVHGRMVVPRPERDRGGERPVVEHRPPVDTAPGGGVGAADGPVGALDERADRRPGQEQDSGDREGGAGDQRARAADQGPDHLVERGADVAARVREQEEHAERHRGEAPAERVNLDQATAAEHQRADDDERRRDQVAGVAHERPQAVNDPAARRASLPPQVDERREEQPDRGEAEADQLGMVVAALLRRALPALHARGHARSEGALLAALRHRACFDAAATSPLEHAGVRPRDEGVTRSPRSTRRNGRDLLLDRPKASRRPRRIGAHSSHARDGV